MTNPEEDRVRANIRAWLSDDGEYHKFLSGKISKRDLILNETEILIKLMKKKPDIFLEMFHCTQNAQ